nr:ParB/RepB/Spo0J family partition protein [Maliibacterium massiliense]
MAQKRGLGKGLGALIGGAPLEQREVSQAALHVAEEAPRGAQEVPISAIDPNADQPRKHFDTQALETLADSIKQHGLVQPIIVRRDGARYTIIAGERRWRAARIAGLARVPILVKDDIDDRAMMEMALVENLQRQDLNPVEEAQAIAALMQEYQLTQEQVARRVGRSRSAVANVLRLLTLDERVQGMLRDGALTEGQARPLAVLSAPDQRALAERITREGLSARQVEALVQAMQQQAQPEKPRRAKAALPELAMLEETLRGALGARVQVKGDLEKGTITVSYYSRSDLERIFEVATNINPSEQ